MTAPKIGIYTPMGDVDAQYETLENAGCTLAYGDPSWRVKMGATLDDVLEVTNGSTAMIGAIVRGVTFTDDLFAALPDLRIIAKLTIGYDDIDLDAATRRGVLVTHSPTEANWGGVAEGTMAMMLSLLKRIRERDRHVRDGGWRDPELVGTYLGARQDGYEGITVGIIGLGRIGSRLADLLAPWRVRLIAYDPYVDESKFAHHNVQAVDLDTLLAESDVVSLHANLTDETTHLMSEGRFAAMKPTAILINAARGPIVDEDALYFALDRGEIAGAALDVFEVEPLDPQSALLGLGDKILLSPHMISANRNSSLEPAVSWTIRATLAALRGEVPRHVVNPDAIPAWEERFGGKNVID